MTSLSSSSLQRNVLAVWATTFALLAMVAFVDAGAVIGLQRNDKQNALARGINFENLSGRKVDMFWVNTFKSPEEFVPQFVEDGVSIGCPYGADKSLSSYVGHVFEVREVASKITGSCVLDECRKFRVKVSDRNEQRIVIHKDFSYTVRDDKERAFTKADDMFTKCKDKMPNKIDHPLDSIKLITECMEEEINGKVNFDRKERAFHSMIQREMATDLIPFTCGDVNKTQSYEIKNQTWSYENQKHILKTLHKLPTSEIFIVEDFVSVETCNALKKYRQKVDHGDIMGVPSDVTTEGTKQADLLMDLFYKMYGILMHRFKDWKQLDFSDDLLFEYIKDMVGLKTPSHLCTTQEEVDEVVAAMEDGLPKTCHIPGGVPEAVPTTHFVVEEGLSEEEKKEKRQLAQLFLFCDEPKQQLGGLHFPYAAVHVTPKPGKLVVAVHRHPNDRSAEFDGYVNEYHLCPNHEIYIHTVNDHNPEIYGEDMDEGEL